MTLTDAKLAFLKYELGILTIKAALSTRSKLHPIYAAGQNAHQRATALRAFRRVLAVVERKYATSKVEETEHVQFIDDIANRVSTELGSRLHEERLRVGVAQKLVNLHLKYLWVVGLIDEPPHCPLDGIVRDEAGLIYDWISSDSIDDYGNAINLLKETARPKSVAVWELEKFRRRAQ